MNESFHFLRPEWLFALLPLMFLSWLLLRKRLFSRSWQSVIDPKLLPHLLIGKPGKTSRIPIFIFFISGVIGIFALAGPVWEQLPQPVFKEQSALIIALDLSKSMDAGDIKPTRLARARHKISDILSLRKEGQTALIAYAAEAFTVSPLTDDAATIDSLVPSLETGIMPAQGSRADIALEKADELLTNAGIAKGDILFVTDGISESEQSAFADFSARGHRISILAIGTNEGGPIALDHGGFLKDAAGSIVIPKLNSLSLRSTALKAGGRFSLMTADDADIKHLLALLDVNRAKAESKATDMQADVWREEGPWLLLALMPLAALAFRRGYLSILILFMLPHPQADALTWDELWINSNQRAEKQFEQGNANEAASLFRNEDWKASAHYKAGQYEQALKHFETRDTVDGHYNRGNTLAKMGQMQQAIDAYNKTLELDPKHEDALHNKKLLEELQKNQQNQSNQDKSKQDSQDQQNSEQQNKSEQSSDQQQDQSAQQQESDQQQQEQQAEQNQQQQSEQQDKEQQQAQQAEESESEKSDEEKQAEQQQAMNAEQQDLSQQAQEQWLRRIPDDPGGLLKRKFKYQYQRQNKKSNEVQPW